MPPRRRPYRHDLRSLVRALPALLRRPHLWPTAARQVRRLAPDDWWRRAPFLPVPPRGYLRFRHETAYGGDGRGVFGPQEIVTYLEWCRQWRVFTGV